MAGGFMAGPLGFASTIGAAIGGAARQANEQFAEQRVQERQDDLMQQQVWMNKADNAAKQHNEENKAYSTKQAMWKSIADSTKNPAVADAAMNYFETAPKVLEDPDKRNNIIANFAAQLPKPGADYTSPYLKGLGQQSQAGYEQAQAMGQRLNPKYRGMALQPNSPFSPDNSYAQQSNPQMGGSPVGPPGASPDTVSTPQATGVAPSPVRSIPGAPGAPVAGPSRLDTSPEVNSGPNDPNATPIPLDGPAPTNVTPLASQANPAGQQPGQPGAMPNGQLGTTAYQYTPVKTNHNTAMTPNEIADHDLKEREFAWKKGQKPEGPDAITDNAIRQHSAIKNTDDYLGDLYNRKKQQSTVSEISNDANDFIRMLQTGNLKTGAAQPFVDGVNRILSSMGVDDLKKYGIANSVNDTNEAGKIMGRLMFGQIPNYHLGRWTDREFATLNKLIPEMGKDPNTNLKIALLLKTGADRSANSTRDEYKALGSNANNPNVSAAMKISNDYMDQNKNLPWVSVNRSAPTDEMRSQYNDLPKGGYWEDAQTGILHVK